VLDRKILFLEKIHTSDNGVNILTKVLLLIKFEVCRWPV
jgi:hypothetical protein